MTEEPLSPLAADDDIGFPIVGVGASAGGLEAIEQMFEEMPLHSGMAFVLVQHLSPDFKSHMAELLERKTKIPVRRVIDGMIVEANHIPSVWRDFDGDFGRDLLREHLNRHTH
jgi:two-component system CheB/CheR fusion protein